MAIADIETPITYFANPFLKCASCNTRVVGVVGLATTTALPAGRNWPCYHAAGRVSLCVGWTSTAGCPHTPQERATHNQTSGVEGNRR